MIRDRNWIRSRCKIVEECWIWIGAKTPLGYGKFSIGSKTVASHRHSYVVHKGAIKSGHCVMHSCDNPACCNPDHLSCGTAKDNVADMIEKGRQALGDKKSHITSGQVRLARQLHSIGVKQMYIRKLIPVSSTVMSFLINRKTWRNA